jgi:peptidoglycan/LPS O-acetylase OafA/YrhL
MELIEPMGLKENLKNRIRGWLPKKTSLPHPQRKRMIDDKLIGRLIGLIGVLFFTILLAFALPHWLGAGDFWPIYGLMIFLLVGLLAVFLVRRRGKMLNRSLQRTEVSTLFGIAIGFLAGSLMGILAVVMRVIVEGVTLPFWGWPLLFSLVGTLIFIISIGLYWMKRRSLNYRAKGQKT